MKRNNDYTEEDLFSFNKININKIIIIVILFLLTINNLNIKKCIKKVEYLEHSINKYVKTIKNTKSNLMNNDIILNQQIEAILSYLLNYKKNSSIYQLLEPKAILGKKKVRIGSKKDGGYILLNDFENIKIAYSFGINNEVSFDKDLADKNIDIFMYDHTIEKLPFENKRFHWKKIGLTEKMGKGNNMKTLYELIQENGHSNEKNMILKIDIEGQEWNVFNKISEDILTQFKYILVEFHFNNKFASHYLQVFKKINRSHQIFHLHCNNYGSIIYFDGNIICSALEISFLIKKNNKFMKYNDFFPIRNIDYKNNKNKIDMNLFLNIYQIDKLLKK